MIETIRKESKIFKEEIKKIDSVIKTKQNKIIVLKIEKQKLEKERKKHFGWLALITGPYFDRYF